MSQEHYTFNAEISIKNRFLGTGFVGAIATTSIEPSIAPAGWVDTAAIYFHAVPDDWAGNTSIVFKHPHGMKIDAIQSQIQKYIENEYHDSTAKVSINHIDPLIIDLRKN